MSLWRVVSILGVGIGRSIQYLRPFQRRDSIPGGGVFVVHKLWNAVWLFCRS